MSSLVPDRLFTRRWMLLLLLVAALPRFWALGEKSLWVDEAKSVQISRRVEDILPYCRKGNTPPLRYYMLNLLQKGRPPEAWVRLPSALSSLACIPLLYFLGAQLFTPGVGLIAALLFAFSPWQIENAQDARMYSVFLLCVILALHALFRAQETGQWRWWAWLGAVMALGAYLSYFALWTSFIIALYVVLSRLIVMARDRDAFLFRNRLRLMGLCLALVVAGISYLPWLWNVLRLILSYTPPEEPPPVPQLPLLNPFFTLFNFQYFDDFVRQMSASNRFIGYGLLFLAVTGLIVAWRKRRDFFLFALLWFVVPIIIFFFSDVRFFFPQRYLIYYHPVYLILAATGLMAFAEFLARHIANWIRRPAAQLRPWVAALIMVLILPGFAHDTLDILRYEKQDWRGAALYLTQNTTPGDIVVTGQAWTEQSLLFYLHPRALGVDVAMHLYKLDEFEGVLITKPRLWYISWGPLPIEVQKITAKYLLPVKTLPGRYGDITIYRSKRYQER